MKRTMWRGLSWALGLSLCGLSSAQNFSVGGNATYASNGMGYYQTQVGEQPAYVSASGGCSYDRNSNTRIKPDKGTIVVTPKSH